MTRGSKRNITEWHRNLSIGASSTGTTGGEAGLVFIFWLLLVLLVGLPRFVQPKATIEASLSRLMLATQQVGGKYDMKATNKDGLTLGFDLQKAVVIPYALINLVNE
jgi:hypothetical protein